MLCFSANCKSVTPAVAHKHTTAHFLYKSYSDSNVRPVHKTWASMLTSSDEQMISTLICLREMRRTWLCSSALWTPARCPGTNLAYHCHLLGLRSTEKQWCQMKNWPGQWCCYINAWLSRIVVCFLKYLHEIGRGNCVKIDKAARWQYTMFCIHIINHVRVNSPYSATLKMPSHSSLKMTPHCTDLSLQIFLTQHDLKLGMSQKLDRITVQYESSEILL